MSLEIGQAAPDFSIPIHENQKVDLNHYQGKKLILYFYPKDDTPGCTLESCAFRDAYEQIQEAGANILGISQDGMASHKKFKEKYALPFDLGADEEGTVCKLYDVLKQKSMYGRTFWGIERSTFLIDEHSKLTHIWRKVSVSGHLKEVLESLKN